MINEIFKINIQIKYFYIRKYFFEKSFLKIFLEEHRHRRCLKGLVEAALEDFLEDICKFIFFY